MRWPIDAYEDLVFFYLRISYKTSFDYRIGLVGFLPEKSMGKSLMMVVLACSIAGCMHDSNGESNTLDSSHHVVPAAVSDRTNVKENTDTSHQKVPEYAYGSKTINTGTTTPEQLLAYATSLQGVPYKYGSVNPAEGFDCSGFITHVFNHFNIAVPRSSVDFTNVEREVPLEEAKPGDLVLFTGTDSTVRVVGHMGIINSANGNEMSFIHSTSGKADGVTITPLNRYYMGRFMKVIRIFN